LGLSQKTTQETARLNRGLENSISNLQNNNKLTSNVFFKNSDHSDLNRWLKRG
jgi:hypothetical protein